MSQAVAKTLTRQATGPEMSDYLDQEIYQLCECIQDNGQPLSSGGLASIRFIELHKLHSVVSNRISHVLIKARKNGYIDFKGELLLQGKDDNEPVKLIKMPPKAVQITKSQMMRKAS